MYCGNYTNYKWNSCLAQLHLRGRGWTNSPPLFNNWDDAGQPLSPTWSHLGHLLAGIAMSSWRSTERYEDFIFWKRSVSLSFLGVFLCCVGLGCVCVWVCFVSTLEDTWLFAFHLFSNKMRIADRRQDVLMTVRASSVHGMSYNKKKLASDLSLLGWLLGTNIFVETLYSVFACTYQQAELIGLPPPSWTTDRLRYVCFWDAGRTQGGYWNWSTILETFCEADCGVGIRCNGCGPMNASVAGIYCFGSLFWKALGT